MKPLNVRRELERLWLPALRKIPTWTGVAQMSRAGSPFLRVFLSDLKTANRLPSFDGLAFDVKPMPLFRAAPLAAEATPAPVGLRPTTSVNCIARKPDHTTISGKFGMVSGFIEGTGSKLWLLSNNHVVSDNGRLTRFENAGDGVQAGSPLHSVSTDVHFIQIANGGDNRVDAAICRLKDGEQLTPPLYPAAWNIKSGIPKRPADGDMVRYRNKFGADVTGKVVHHSFSVPIKLNLSGDVNLPVMTDQILVQLEPGGVLTEGDSGSLLVVNADGGTQPAGIVVGFPDDGSNHNILVTPLDSILSAFKDLTGDAKSIKIA